MKISKLLDEMIEKIEEVKIDVDKFENRGVASAGTKVRKKMQEIKVIANEIRSVVTEVRNERKDK